MAIAFKPPEIQYHGHYQPQSPPPSPPPPGAVSATSNGQVQTTSVASPAVAATVADGSVTVTDSVPRSHAQIVPQPILVPQSVVFHPIPPIFLVPHQPSPPPSPSTVYRIVGPRQSCPPREQCRICQDIQRASLLLSLVVLNLVL